MPYTGTGKTNNQYFVNLGVLELLEDIHKFYDTTSRRPMIEKQLDTIHIEFDNASQLYLATVAIDSYGQTEES